ncbi:MAG: VOC family protein [Proteobacteria bacterium]|nr:VOC family protein [Pseudomonadota bacterium]
MNYIEYNVSDIARSKEFYGYAFGWSFTDYGPDYCEFSDGQMKGGFAAAEDPSAIKPGGALVILYGDDLMELQGRVEAAGGAIVKTVFEFPGGQRFHFTDPDGYELAVWTEA